MTTDSGLAVLNLDLLSVGHLVETEFLGDLGADLGGVTIDGLASSDHNVNITDLLDSGGEGVRGGKRVSSSEEPVCQQPTGVSASIKSLTDDLPGAGRAHSEDSHGRSGILFLETECLLESEKVVRIENGGQGGAVDGTFGRHRILADIPCVGHLLSQDNNFQFHIDTNNLVSTIAEYSGKTDKFTQFSATDKKRYFRVKNMTEYDKNPVRVPWQYMPVPDGGIRDEGPGPFQRA